MIKNINKNKKLSFDIKDFDLSFVRGLSYEDGLSTLTKFTSEIICDSIIKNTKKDKTKKINLLVCGGGRKNLTLIENITNKLPNNINLDLIWNIGIGFGFLSTDSSLIYNFISMIIGIVILYLVYIFIESEKLDKIIYSIIIGGALGNFYDRILYKAVPDFIDIHYSNMHWFTFNIADVFITIGILIFIIKHIKCIIKNLLNI